MYLYVMLEVAGQDRPGVDLPRVAPGAEGEGDYAPVRWEARYTTRADAVSGAPAVLVFTDLDKACDYAGRLLADGADVAITSTLVGELQDRAFDGDPNGWCIVNPSTEYPPGLGVEVSRIYEWWRVEEETSGQ